MIPSPETLDSVKINYDFFYLFKIEYEIKWMGFGENENSWVPAKWCDCAEKIIEFEMTNTKWNNVDEIIGKRVKNGEVIRKLHIV